MTTNEEQTSSAISQVDPSEASALMEGGSTLLDVRTLEEFAGGHAPGVTFIPLHEIEERVEELDETSSLVVICRLGGRSQSAAEFLASRGFRVSNVMGGMVAWAADGFPVVDDQGNPGQIL